MALWVARCAPSCRFKSGSCPCLWAMFQWVMAFRLHLRGMTNKEAKRLILFEISIDKTKLDSIDSSVIGFDPTSDISVVGTVCAVLRPYFGASFSISRHISECSLIELESMVIHEGGGWRGEVGWGGGRACL